MKTTILTMRAVAALAALSMATALAQQAEPAQPPQETPPATEAAAPVDATPQQEEQPTEQPPREPRSPAEPQTEPPAQPTPAQSTAETGATIEAGARDQTPANGAADRLAAQQPELGMRFSTTADSLVVSSIEPGSVFAQAGLQQGDQIVSFADQRFVSQPQFYSWLTTIQPGQRVPIVVFRDGRQYTLYWTPTEAFIAQLRPMPVGRSYFGIHLNENVHNAALVAAVERNSPAAQAGVRQGDYVVGLAGQRIANSSDFAAVADQLPPGQPIDISVSRVLALRMNEYRAPQQAVPAAGPLPADTPRPVITPAPEQPAVVVPPRVEERRVPLRPRERRGLFRRN